MAEMIPVTKTTIPSTQNRPWHLVKSTFQEKSFVCKQAEQRESTAAARDAAHLGLEAENCDADADDRCDGYRQKHHFCVVVTKKSKKNPKYVKMLLYLKC